MLLLLDLDNTLIDRRAAFERWADSRYGPDQTPWLIDIDRGGYEAREVVAARIAERFGDDADRVLTELRAGMIENIVFDPDVGAALSEAAAAGFVPVVVTNGTVAQQEAKLRHTGLDRMVAGWIVSEGVGVRKPDRRIFERAAASVGLPLTGWMVGDNPAYDIVGGAAAGLRTAWVSDGLTWPADVGPRPTVIADRCAVALREVIGLLAADPAG